MLGIVTPEQLAGARAAGRGGDTVGSMLDETFVHVHPDHSLDITLERFAESPGLLPVVSRAALRVEGVITIDDITRFAKHGKADRAPEGLGDGGA